MTGEYKALGGLITRFEYRTDFSDGPFFLDDDDDLSDNQSTVSIAFIYAFSSKHRHKRRHTYVNHRDTENTKTHGEAFGNVG